MDEASSPSPQKITVQNQCAAKDPCLAREMHCCMPSEVLKQFAQEAIYFKKEQAQAISSKGPVPEDEHVLAQSRRTFPAAGVPDVGIAAEDSQNYN
jgi:hypothetical protein